MASDMIDTGYSTSKPFKLTLIYREEGSVLGNLRNPCGAPLFLALRNTLVLGYMGWHLGWSIRFPWENIPQCFWLRWWPYKLCLVEHEAGFRIYAGSHAAIVDTNIKSSLVGARRKNLKDLSMENQITLHWVPGYKGVEGNEEAETLG